MKFIDGGDILNLFEKYGIKEVADVVFYSINQVGEDEIVYTPVLYLDTLKVSTFEKSAESVFATGGLKNKNLIKWNYGKKISLNLEDALFSPASMSLIWGGRLDHRLSNATSVVSKINFANTYGRLQYSIKAYPSPVLTNEEWEIIFKIIGLRLINPDTRVSFDRIPDDYTGTSWILDCNYYSSLPDNYKNAFRNRYAARPYLFNGIEKINDKQGEETWTYTYDDNNFGTSFEESYLRISMMQLDGYEGINEHYDDLGKIKPGHEKWYEAKAMPEYIVYKIRQEICEIEHLGQIETETSQLEVVDRMEKCMVSKKEGLTIDIKKQLDNLFRYYANDRSNSYTIYYDVKTMLPLVGLDKDGKIGRTYEEELYTQGGTFDISETARTYSEYHNGASVLNILKRYEGKKLYRQDVLEIENTYGLDNEARSNKSLDYAFRWMCAKGLESKGVAFDYSDIINDIEDYCFDAVNFSIYSGNMITIAGTIISATTNGKQQIKIKFGTTYYKWTRTVKYKEYEDDSILGQSFVINSETFPNDYRIVCETYIRNQKTGKDQRYQIVIFKANVSSDTSITLQADGEPTTFNMTIDVLTPENDIMMDIRQLDVEEDRFEGGTRIVPQSSRFTSTPSMDVAGEVVIPIDNNEIY